uniref:Uncharacterized protein n=1 Tax=viral metagenome TaxID=1070528 RepID=A0A6M3LLS3_9ZZZZ
MKSQTTLIEEFVNEGATEGDSSHMYIDGDVLYSYGRHFPLLVRRDWGFLLNADKYSVTTSKHQYRCFRHATIQLPFSALNSAKVSFRDFALVAHDEQRYDTIGYRKANTDDKISVAEYEKLTAEQQEGYYPIEERRPEAAILEQNGERYLSSMDGWNYFLCKLPEPVGTVEEAFASLKPVEVTDDNYIRQGEWFFVEMPLDKAFIKKEYGNMEKNFVLPTKNPDGNLHIATRGYENQYGIFVSGQIRHKTRWGGKGDHRMLRLSTLDNMKIFQAFENRALGSWSASGNVD